MIALIFWIGMAQMFWHQCICTYFSLRYPSSLCFHSHCYIKQVFSWWESFVNCLQITEDIIGYINSKNSLWIGQLSVKSSIWIGCFFQRPGIWLGMVSKYWLAYPHQNYPESPPPTITEDMKGYINSKNNLCQLSVKSSIWIGCFCFQRPGWGWFQNTDLQTRIKITPSPPTPLLKLDP